MTELTDAFGCEDLQAHSTRLQALARQVAADAHTADDLAQEALIGELRRGEAKRRNAGWFFSVLRNLARRESRGAHRRQRREQAVARTEEVASTLDVVQHAETLEHVVRAALALDEPYRTTILLRYLRDRSVEEVARAMGVPRSTVRVRTKRAIERLRESLRRSLGSGYALLLLRFAEPVPVSPSSMNPNPEPGGIMDIGVWNAALVAAAITVSTGVTALLTSGLESGPQEPARVALMSPVAAEAHKRRPVTLRAAAAGGAAVPGHAEHGASTAHPPLTGRVVDHLGEPVEGARVRVFDRPFRGSSSIGNGDLVAEPIESVTGPFGTFSIATRHPFASWGLAVDATGFAQTLTNHEPYRDDPIRLFPATDLIGKVTDAGTGQALVGVSVRVRELTLDEGRARLVRTTTTDTAGAYRLVGVRAERRVSLEFAKPGAACHYVTLDLRAGKESRHDIAFASSASAEITVIDDATGKPIPDASVFSAGRVHELVGRTGAQGRLTIEVPWTPGASIERDFDGRPRVLAHAEGYCATIGGLRAPRRGGVQRLQLRLVRSARIDGVVLDADGAPVAGACVTWHAPPLRFVEPRGTAILGPDSRNALTDRDGRFEFPHVVPVERAVEGELRAYAGGRMARIANALPPRAGETHSVELRFGSGFAVSGRATINGVGARAWVSIESVDDSSNRSSTRAVADGRFAFFDLAPGHYRVSVRTESNAVSGAHEIEVQSNRENVDIDVKASLTEIRGRVLFDDGTPVVGREVAAYRIEDARPIRDGDEPGFELGLESAESGGGGFQMVTALARTDANGEFLLSVTPNPRARYRLAVYQGGFGVVADRVVEGASDIELRVPPLRRVRVELARERDGSAVQRAGVRWKHAASKREVTLAWRRAIATAAGTLSLELPVGEVELTVRDADSELQKTVKLVVPLEGDGASLRVRL